MGPYIVTKDELPTPENVNIVTKVNNDIRQDGNTSQMINKIDDLIEEISKYVALHPGDIIATGTPPEWVQVYNRLSSYNLVMKSKLLLIILVH